MFRFAAYRPSAAAPSVWWDTSRMQKAFRPGRAASYHGPMPPAPDRLYVRACFFAHSNDCCSDLLVVVKPSGDDAGCCAAARLLHARRTTVSTFWGFVIIGSPHTYTRVPTLASS